MLRPILFCFWYHIKDNLFVQLLNKKRIKATCVAKLLNLLTKMLSGSSLKRAKDE